MNCPHPRRPLPLDAADSSSTPASSAETTSKSAEADASGPTPARNTSGISSISTPSPSSVPKRQRRCTSTPPQVAAITEELLVLSLRRCKETTLAAGVVQREWVELYTLPTAPVDLDTARREGWCVLEERATFLQNFPSSVCGNLLRPAQQE